MKCGTEKAVERTGLKPRALLYTQSLEMVCILFVNCHTVSKIIHRHIPGDATLERLHCPSQSACLIAGTCLDHLWDLG